MQYCLGEGEIFAECERNSETDECWANENMKIYECGIL